MSKGALNLLHVRSSICVSYAECDHFSCRRVWRGVQCELTAYCQPLATAPDEIRRQCVRAAWPYVAVAAKIGTPRWRIGAHCNCLLRRALMFMFMMQSPSDRWERTDIVPLSLFSQTSSQQTRTKTWILLILFSQFFFLVLLLLFISIFWQVKSSAWLQNRSKHGNVFFFFSTNGTRNHRCCGISPLVWCIERESRREKKKIICSRHKFSLAWVANANVISAQYI